MRAFRSWDRKNALRRPSCARVASAGTILNPPVRRPKSDSIPHNATIKRNKRCALAYVESRASRIKRLRWEIGPLLPEDILRNLSNSEKTFLSEYDKLLTDYKTNTCVDVTADLSRTGSVIGVEITDPGLGYFTSPPLITFEDPCNQGYGSAAEAVVDFNPSSPTYGQITSVNVISVGENYPVYQQMI